RQPPERSATASRTNCDSLQNDLRQSPERSATASRTICDSLQNDLRQSPEPPMPFDVVIVGGGHNGLVAATFLAKAGLKTIVLERSDRVGGCARLAHTAAIDPAI